MSKATERDHYFVQKTSTASLVILINILRVTDINDNTFEHLQ